MSTALTETERVKLGDLELVIERGLQTFVEVGAALSQIPEQRLSRQTHGTFEDYCQERWGWDKRHANRHIEASKIVKQLGSMDPKPTSVRQTRELAKVPEPQRAEVWETVMEEAPIVNGRPKITARQIATAAGWPHLHSVGRRRVRPGPPGETDGLPPGGFGPASHLTTDGWLYRGSAVSDNGR